MLVGHLIFEKQDHLTFIHLCRSFEGCSIRYKGDSISFDFAYDSKVWACPRLSGVTPLEEEAICPMAKGGSFALSIQGMEGSSTVVGAIGQRSPYRWCYQSSCCYPESCVQQYLETLGSGKRMNIYHIQGHLAPNEQAAFCQ